MAAKYLIQKQTALEYGVLVVANACEEGLGNLDGTKALFAEYGTRIQGFYSFDIYMRFAAAVPWVLIGIRSPVKRPVVIPMQILATPVPFNCCVDS